MACEVLDFVIGGPIFEVVLDVGGLRMRVIADQFVKVVAQVVKFWIPETVFIVNKVYCSSIVQFAQNVILLTIVMREDNLVSCN